MLSTAVIKRTVCCEYASGDCAFSEGEPGNERGVRIEYANGDKQHYEGRRGAERIVKLEYNNGDVLRFEGARGQEQCVEDTRGTPPPLAPQLSRRTTPEAAVQKLLLENESLRRQVEELSSTVSELKRKKTESPDLATTKRRLTPRVGTPLAPTGRGH